MDTSEIDPVSNGAGELVESTRPYRVVIKVQGLADVLLHGWNIEAVEEKGNAAKGSKSKKTDNLESYVYRGDKGQLCLKGDALRASMADAARYEQDPRSPRKSARDLVKQGLIPLTPFATLSTPLAPKGVTAWEYVAKHRVVVQRSAITRSRPALREGWFCEFDMMVNSPEYLTVPFLQKLVASAGKLQGLGDYRPTYGRFTVVAFDVRPF